MAIAVSIWPFFDVHKVWINCHGIIISVLTLTFCFGMLSVYIEAIEKRITSSNGCMYHSSLKQKVRRAWF